MANENLNQLTPSVKEQDLHDELLIDLANSMNFKELHGQPAVTSFEVAKHFQKKHSHVLRDIERIISIIPQEECKSNFGLTSREVTQPYGGVRKEKYYLMTEEAFSLVCMGFTGTVAIRWKWKYIKAFEAMRANMTLASIEYSRNEAYKLGYNNARSEMLPLTVSCEIATKEAYLKGMKEGSRVQKQQDTLLRFNKIMEYKNRGLKPSEVAKLIGMSTSGMNGLIKRVKFSLIGV